MSNKKSVGVSSQKKQGNAQHASGLKASHFPQEED
jgi:hypothetical protein